MKTIIFICLLFIPTMAFSENVLYRISSNEVSIITSESIVAGNPDNAVVVITDFPDGTETRSNDSLRVLGTAKILDGTTVRNATQEEIDTFLPAVLDDYAIRDAQQALNLFNNDVKLRKVLIAFAAILVDEINILRSEHSLSDRTLEQLKTAIQNRISKHD